MVVKKPGGKETQDHEIVGIRRAENGKGERDYGHEWWVHQAGSWGGKVEIKDGIHAGDRASNVSSSYRRSSTTCEDRGASEVPL